METRSRGKKIANLPAGKHRYPDKNQDTKGSFSDDSSTICNMKDDQQKCPRNKPGGDANKVCCMRMSTRKTYNCGNHCDRLSFVSTQSQCEVIESDESKPSFTFDMQKCPFFKTRLSRSRTYNNVGRTSAIVSSEGRRKKSVVSEGSNASGTTTRSISLSPRVSRGNKKTGKQTKQKLCCKMLTSKYGSFRKHENTDKPLQFNTDSPSETSTVKPRGDIDTNDSPSRTLEHKVLTKQIAKTQSGKEIPSTTSHQLDGDDILDKAVDDHTYACPTTSSQLLIQTQNTSNALPTQNELLGRSETPASQDDNKMKTHDTLHAVLHSRVQMSNQVTRISFGSKCKDNTPENDVITLSTGLKNPPAVGFRRIPTSEDDRSYHINTKLKDTAVVGNEKVTLTHRSLDLAHQTSNALIEEPTEDGPRGIVKDDVTTETSSGERHLETMTLPTVGLASINNGCFCSATDKSTLHCRDKPHTVNDGDLSDEDDENPLQHAGNGVCEFHDAIVKNIKSESILNNRLKESLKNYDDNELHRFTKKPARGSQTEGCHIRNSKEDVDTQFVSSTPNGKEPRDVLGISGESYDLQESLVEDDHTDKSDCAVDSGDVRDIDGYDNRDVIDYCEMVIRNSILLLKTLSQITDSCSSSEEIKQESNEDYQINKTCDDCPRTSDTQTIPDEGLQADRVSDKLGGILYYTGPENPAGISPWWYISFGGNTPHTNTEHVSTGSKDTAYQRQFVDWLNRENVSSGNKDPQPKEKRILKTPTGIAVADYETDTDEEGDISDLNLLSPESSRYLNLDLWSEIDDDLDCFPDYKTSNDLCTEWHTELDAILLGNRTSDWRQDDFQVLGVVDPSSVLDVVLPMKAPLQAHTAAAVNSGYASNFHNNKHMLVLSDGGSSTLSCSGDDTFSGDDSDSDLNLSFLYDSSDLNNEGTDDSSDNTGRGKNLFPLFKSQGRPHATEEDPELYTVEQLDMPFPSRKPPSSWLPEGLIQQWTINKLLELDDMFLDQDESQEICSSGDLDNSTLKTGCCERTSRNLSGYEADLEPGSPFYSRKDIQYLITPSGKIRESHSQLPRTVDVSRRPKHSILGVCDPSPRKTRTTCSDQRISDADDLADMSVENTVDFFMRMSSPLKSKEVGDTRVSEQL